MADTYTWGIANLERKLADGLVYTAHWTLSAERITETETYTAGSYGSIGFSDPDPENFIPYDELELETVITWVQDALGEEKVAEMEAALSSQLDSQQTPTDGSGVPW
jgi:hypothetical protein